MSGNLGYTKKFIILKRDFSNMVGLNPKGHGKIEIKGIKGNISLSLENAEEDQYYNVLLIDRNKSYDLGKIYTEKNGKGREDIVFNLQDLESKGFQVNKLNGVVISRDANILLGGYMDKEDGSIERFVKNLDIKEEPVFVSTEIEDLIIIEPTVEESTIEEPVVEEPAIEEVVVEEVFVEEIIPQEIVLEEIIPQDIIVEEVIPGDPIEELIEVEPEILEIPAKDIFIEDSVVMPLKTIEPEDDFEPIFEPILELSQEIEPVVEDSNEEVVDIKDFDYELNRRVVQRNQTTNYVLNILRYFPYIDPFKINLKGYNWWKIDFQDEAKGFLPYFSYLVGGDQKSRRTDNVTARELMSVYSHYLFGLYNIGDDVKYYVYGVPGGFYKDEHPHGGMTGFNTWFSGNEAGGYWLLYIDPLTGNIIYPINPMMPTD